MKHTVFYKNPPIIAAVSSVVGPKEANGPLGEYFDIKLDDDKDGQKTYELGETMFQQKAFNHALKKCGKKTEDIGALIAGDLVNEIFVSSCNAKGFNIPFLGIYGACSTFGEGLIIASSFISGGLIESAACISSSHFSSVERQYRFPLELGTQPAPTAQWTVTGAGCAVLSGQGKGPKITCATIGRVIDMGVADAGNMGAAMAPAAVDTVLTHLKDTGRTLDYYDLIYTGDLGRFGRSLFVELMQREGGLKVGKNYNDCGSIIYEDKHSVQGGSGAGCVAVTYAAFLHNLMEREQYNKLLLVPTGALLNKVSSLEGESIPCIAHAVAIEN